MVPVEKIAENNNGRNEVYWLGDTKTREYTRNGIGMKSMNKTAKNTPTAYDLF